MQSTNSNHQNIAAAASTHKTHQSSHKINVLNTVSEPVLICQLERNISVTAYLGVQFSAYLGVHQGSLYTRNRLGNTLFPFLIPTHVICTSPLVNFFLLLSYHSLTSHYFLSHLCSLFCLLLLFIFIFFRPSHYLPLLHQSVLHLFFRCVCSFHLVQVFFISFFSLFSFLFHLVC